MKIDHYISQLLYRYQCVTVPGFGAFLTETQSAQLDEISHSFYPPKKHISFNPYIKNNDGLLANHLVQSEKINYDAAVSIIQNEVSTWNSSIFEFGKFSIKNIGTFSLNMERNLVFIPSNQVNYLKESFGLSSFTSTKITREVYKEEIEQLEDKVPIQLTPEKRKNNSWLKYAAAAVLTLGVSSSICYKLYKNYELRIEQQTLIVQQLVQKKVNKKIQQATFFIQSPLDAVTLTVPSEKMSFHIVAGAFRIETNAEKTLQRLLHLGFKAKRIAPNKHGLYPVLYGSFSSYSEAYNMMKKIQSSDNKDAWILIEEL